MRAPLIITALCVILPVVAPADWGPAERLPAPVNDGYSFAPFISADGKTLYFSRWSAETDYDIYYSEKVGTSWTTPQKVPGAVNTPGVEMNSCISWDGKYLYFDRIPEGSNNQDIYVAEKIGSVWGNVRPVPGQVNRPNGSEFAPCISGDGKTLYFSAWNRPGNEGPVNIWASNWTGTEWGTPYYLQGVNTPYGECDQAITYDDHFLYFFSPRPKAGGMYRAERVGNGWGNVEYLNENINNFDYGGEDPTLTASGRELYFTAYISGYSWIYVSRWECEPAVAPTSLGKIKAIYH